MAENDTNPVAVYFKSLSDEGKIDFVCWLASKTEYGSQELVDWHKDVLVGVKSFNLMFKHYPVHSNSFGAIKMFFVGCRGKTKEEAIEKYKRSFDKERWRTVEYVGG